jgi:formylmethanofuran dehydrogenase subunit A
MAMAAVNVVRTNRPNDLKRRLMSLKRRLNRGSGVRRMEHML